MGGVGRQDINAKVTCIDGDGAGGHDEGGAGGVRGDVTTSRGGAAGAGRERGRVGREGSGAYSAGGRKGD
jgi:hypothetical protein